MQDTHRLKSETTHSEWLASSRPLKLPLFPVGDPSGGYGGNWYSCCSQGSKIWLMEKLFAEVVGLLLRDQLLTIKPGIVSLEGQSLKGKILRWYRIFSNFMNYSSVL